MLNALLRLGFIGSRALRPLLPGECLLCCQPVKGAWDLCASCHGALLPSEHPPEAALEEERAFDALLAPYAYVAPMTHLILQFKNSAKRTAGSLLVDLLLEALQKTPDFLAVDAVVAIPAQKERLKKRTLNPPGWLAQRLAWQVNRPFTPQALSCCQPRVSQQNLSRRARWLNPQGAFLASAQVAGQRLLLVDDVITTGATCHWAAAELKAKGAAQVKVLAACKTPR